MFGVRVISFEGCIGSGKTSLTNYFSHGLNYHKIIEDFNANPFLEEFYKGLDVRLQAEIVFLLIHYTQLKKAMGCNQGHPVIIADFSIEKDLVFARLNLSSSELRLFESLYEHVVREVGISDTVVYLNVSQKVLRRRIFQRGREYEVKTEPEYFARYNETLQDYFETQSQSKVHLVNADDLVLEPDDPKVSLIRQIILGIGAEPAVSVKPASN